jgi:hypothetical protein
MSSFAANALVAVLCAMTAAGAADAGSDASAVPRVAFLGFELINTSLEPTAPAEAERIRMLDDLLRRSLAASGRFAVADLPGAAAGELAAAGGVGNCNGCERELARRVGASRALWGTVQKVSNLILNINVYMEDAQSGRMEFIRSVDIRGNTDESWRRGLDYLLRNYLLRAP